MHKDQQSVIITEYQSLSLQGLSLQSPGPPLFGAVGIQTVPDVRERQQGAQRVAASRQPRQIII